MVRDKVYLLKNSLLSEIQSPLNPISPTHQILPLNDKY